MNLKILMQKREKKLNWIQVFFSRAVQTHVLKTWSALKSVTDPQMLSGKGMK